MAKSKASFNAVRKAAAGLAGVEEGTSYGSPALKVGGKLLTCLAVNKSAEPGSLVVSISFRDRDDLITGDPDTYYLTDHYVDYPVVLVRLSRIRADALRDLLSAAWRFVTAKNQKAGR